MQGLKENVIVGRLIPAGTGGVLQPLQEASPRASQRFAAPRELRPRNAAAAAGDGVVAAQ